MALVYHTIMHHNILNFRRSSAVSGVLLSSAEGLREEETMYLLCRSCREAARILSIRCYPLSTMASLQLNALFGSTSMFEQRQVHTRRLLHDLTAYKTCQRNSTKCRTYGRGSMRGLSTSSPSHRSAEAEAQRSKRPVAQTTIDEAEVQKFSELAELWWDEAGEFEALHSMNEIRVPLIRDALISQRQQQGLDQTFKPSKPLEGMQIVDVGSGGGILSEPLARLGAFVIGVDASEENIKIAQAHVMHYPEVARNIKYIQATVEDLVATEAGKFDAVVASEVVEHVADVSTFVGACCKLVKPGGSIFFTTLNKTYLSYALGVIGAENLLRLVSPGTHDWNKFISPQDLQYILDQSNFSTRLLHGMMYNPLTKRWSWMSNTSINYAVHAVRAADTPTKDS